MSLSPARRRPAHRAPVTTSPRLDRRGFLRVSGLTVAGTAVAGMAGTTSAFAAPTQFAGHQPGKIYVGASGPDWNTTVQRAGNLGLRRTYYTWGNVAGEIRNIKSDHAAGRMPWISFKPHTTARGGWAQIAAGQKDADIRARARAYAGLSQPVIVTFNHEPHNDSTGTPAEFAKAASRIYDVFKNETSLKNVIYTPIIGEWAFNPTNKSIEPQDFLTPQLLQRMHMCGIDLYQNETGQAYDVRLARVVEFLNKAGYSSMPVGLGETGATNGFGGAPDGATWFKKSWSYAVSSGRVAALSYFNSTRNNNLKHNWVLWETSAKLAAYKAAVGSTQAARLR